MPHDLIYTESTAMISSVLITRFMIQVKDLKRPNLEYLKSLL